MTCQAGRQPATTPPLYLPAEHQRGGDIDAYADGLRAAGVMHAGQSTVSDQPAGANVTGQGTGNASAMVAARRFLFRSGCLVTLRQASAIHSVLPDGPELAAGMVPGR